MRFVDRKINSIELDPPVTQLPTVLVVVVVVVSLLVLILLDDYYYSIGTHADNTK